MPLDLNLPDSATDMRAGYIRGRITAIEEIHAMVLRLADSTQAVEDLNIELPATSEVLFSFAKEINRRLEAAKAAQK